MKLFSVLASTSLAASNQGNGDFWLSAVENSKFHQNINFMLRWFAIRKFTVCHLATVTENVSSKFSI